MKNVVLYARLSEGKDINEQINEIREFARNNDYKIIKEFVDMDKQGTNKQRMLVYLNNSDIKTILVSCVDRLTRDMQEYVNYEKSGLEIISLLDDEVKKSGLGIEQQIRAAFNYARRQGLNIKRVK